MNTYGLVTEQVSYDENDDRIDYLDFREITESEVAYVISSLTSQGTKFRLYRITPVQVKISVEIV